MKCYIGLDPHHVGLMKD